MRLWWPTYPKKLSLRVKEECVLDSLMGSGFVALLVAIVPLQVPFVAASDECQSQIILDLVGT